MAQFTSWTGKTIHGVVNNVGYFLKHDAPGMVESIKLPENMGWLEGILKFLGKGGVMIGTGLFGAANLGVNIAGKGFELAGNLFNDYARPPIENVIAGKDKGEGLRRPPATTRNEDDIPPLTPTSTESQDDLIIPPSVPSLTNAPTSRTIH